MITIVLSGTITARSPLATTPPGLTAGKNAPSPLPRMRTTTKEKVSGQTVYFPAGGIRGKLRRHAMAVVRNAIAEAGGPKFTVADHYYNVLGGVAGKKDEGSDTSVDIHPGLQARAANPLVSLFGVWATEFKVGGRLMVGHAIPTTLTEPDVITGVRTEDFARNPGLLDELAEGEAENWLAMADANSERSRLNTKKTGLEGMLRKAKGDDKKKIEDEIKAIEESIAELSKKTFSSNSVGQPLSGYEAIPAGTEMSQEIVVRYGSEDEIGLLLDALDEFARDPVVGAHLNHGDGVIEGEWQVSVRRGAGRFERSGTVRMVPWDGIEVTDSWLSGVWEKWCEKKAGGLKEFDFRMPEKGKKKAA